jgi:hypothetical protein
MALTTAAVVTAGASAYGATRSKTSKKKFKEDPFIRDASIDAVGRARGIADRPYTPYTGQRIAGLSGNEQQASELAGSFSERTQPFRDRLSAGFSQGALSQFENPYLDRVLGNQQRVIGEEYGRQSADLARRQTAMDAFRSGRSDLARSRLDENRLRALGDAEASGRKSAFDTALDAYFRDQGVNLGALSAVTGSTQAEIGALSQTGLAERGITQAGLDFDYGQFLEGRDWDVNNLGPLLNAIQAARGNSQQTSTQPGEDKWSAYGGLLGSLLGGGMFGGGG